MLDVMKLERFILRKKFINLILDAKFVQVHNVYFGWNCPKKCFSLITCQKKSETTLKIYYFSDEFFSSRI